MLYRETRYDFSLVFSFFFFPSLFGRSIYRRAGSKRAFNFSFLLTRANGARQRLRFRPREHWGGGTDFPALVSLVLRLFRFMYDREDEDFHRHGDFGGIAQRRRVRYVYVFSRSLRARKRDRASGSSRAIDLECLSNSRVINCERN